VPRAQRFEASQYEVSDSLDSIDELIGMIRKQIQVSLDDPATRVLASSLVSSSYKFAPDPRTGSPEPYVEFYGQKFYVVSEGESVPPPCKARDFRCEVVKIWNFNVLNVRYTADLDDADLYQDLRTILTTRSGDCDDMTVVFCSLLRAVGMETAARVISLRGDSWDHIYPLVKIPKYGWVALDATEDEKEAGWEYPKPAKYIDFDMGGG